MTETFNGAFSTVPYSDPRAGIAWLVSAFGATATLVVPEDPDQPLIHAEVRVGSGVVIIDDANRSPERPWALAGPVSVYVVVDDPDAMHDRAVAAGAEIVLELSYKDYGSRDFMTRDPHGNLWCFGTYVPGGDG
ncbi:VOC family protein [Mycolicibacterium arenosum]|uniref:VOC family protein n=1 Tax=Mycolicibacterium arenosum TaxID=2952157 RepID=A0ABT1MB01_9MYCO|nr:VOC family protein [Mycolicibacterium sp. CAU 1645]MCP9276035.1 VOC family protein [Mycolicibacterium sp. CAU 1645]